MDLLKTLSELPGAPGREERVRDFIIEQVKDHVDHMEVDAMGNLICRIKGSAPEPKRVMVACHMDEIAFIVSRIDNKGFLRVNKLGGFDTRNLFARRVMIQTRKKGDIFGVFNPAGPPIHVASAEERNKIPQVKDFFVDVGMTAEQAKETFRPGDPVTLVQEFMQMGDYATGKCMDNRVACWLGVRLLQEVSAPVDDLYVVFTVQEEIGVRGALTSAYAVEPHIAIALDVTLAVDIPGVSEDNHITQLGEGAAIKIMDSGSVSSHELVEAFVELAESNEINFQYEVLPLGGTDAAAMQRVRAGAKVITLSVPTRYVHTVTEMIAVQDMRDTLSLLKLYVSGSNA